MLGIDINETKEIQIQDATFIVGIVPHVVRIRVDSLVMGYVEKEKNQSSEDATKGIEGLLKRNLEYVKYGIRGHRGIVDKNGKEIPLVIKKEHVGSREIDVVSDETLDMYTAMGIVPQLFLEAYNANNLTQDEEKN